MLSLHTFLHVRVCLCVRGILEQSKLKVPSADQISIFAGFGGLEGYYRVLKNFTK